MYSADEIMCAHALLSLRLAATVKVSQSVSDRAKRYELRSKAQARPKSKSKPKVEEDECSREERYGRRCQSKAAEEKRDITKRWK